MLVLHPAVTRASRYKASEAMGRVRAMPKIIPGDAGQCRELRSGVVGRSQPRRWARLKIILLARPPRQWVGRVLCEVLLVIDLRWIPGPHSLRKNLRRSLSRQGAQEPRSATRSWHGWHLAAVGLASPPALRRRTRAVLRRSVRRSLLALKYWINLL